MILLENDHGHIYVHSCLHTRIILLLSPENLASSQQLTDEPPETLKATLEACLSSVTIRLLLALAANADLPRLNFNVTLLGSKFYQRYIENKKKEDS